MTMRVCFVVDEENFPWSRACWKREEQIKLWRDNGALFRHVELKSHIACVDAVHLFDVRHFTSVSQSNVTLGTALIQEFLVSLEWQVFGHWIS